MARLFLAEMNSSLEFTTLVHSLDVLETCLSGSDEVVIAMSLTQLAAAVLDAPI